MVVQAYDNYWDLLVNNRHGEPTLIVEVKSKIGTSSTWVAMLRRNILAHGRIPHTPYFLFAFPDKFYLWKNTTEINSIEEREPDYIIDAKPIIKPYLKGTSIQNNPIREKSLEIIVSSWLNDVIYSGKTIADLKHSQSWLIDSGLYSALTEGKIDCEVKF